MGCLVSIMIPIYNQPQYIEQAVKSALGQRYENIEVIVSDDSTNNEVGDILRPYLADKRFSYFKNSDRLGRVGNYRKLLYELAQGEWVIMLDGDDYFLDNNYISNAIEMINKDSSIVLVGAGIKTVNESTNKFESSQLIDKSMVFDGKEVFSKYYGLPSHQTDLYLRSLACKLDFYRNPSAASDSESLYRLCLHGKVGYIANEVAVWRVHDSNTTYTRSLAKQIKELVFIDSIYKYAIAHIDINVAKVWRSNTYRSMATHLINLSFSSNSRIDVLRILIKFGKFFGLRLTLFYVLKLIGVYK